MDKINCLLPSSSTGYHLYPVFNDSHEVIRERYLVTKKKPSVHLCSKIETREVKKNDALKSKAYR